MRFIKIVLIPVFLFFISVILLFSEYEREKVGFFTTIKYYDSKALSGPVDKELLKNEKVIGKFVAGDDNLGTIAVRFNTFWRINDDWMIFRLKETASQHWFYENKYKVDQFQNRKMFPFGFPEIKNSRNKTYTFEIESFQGSTGSAVAVDSKYPSFHTRYRFPKESLFNVSNPKDTTIGKIIVYNVKTVSDYLKQKLAVQFSETGKTIITITYFLPLLLYFLLYKKNYLLNKIVLSLFTFLDILLVSEIYDVSTVILFIGWCCLIFMMKIPKIVTVITGIGLLLVSFLFFYIPKFSTISDKAGSWSLIFFIFSFYYLFSDQFRINEKQR